MASRHSTRCIIPSSVDQPEKIRGLRSDRAKNLPREDELERVDFAIKFADALSKAPTSSGAVIVALYGNWGVGKTTLKNFTSVFLRNDHEIEPIDFHPWQWPNKDLMLDALLVALNSAIDPPGWITKRWRKVEPALCIEHVAAILGLWSPLAGWAKLWWAPAVAMVVGGGLSTFLGKGWADIHPRLHKVLIAVLVIGAGLTFLQLVFEWMAKLRATRGENRIAALPKRREALSSALIKRSKPVVTFIDDLDRLESSEICRVISFIKGTIDLPNLVFVILCQQDVIAGALDSIAHRPGGGAEFLEKIVQVGINVPEPPPGKIRNMADDGLREMLEDPRMSDHWSWSRWDRLYSSFLEVYFRTPRDVIRFLGSLGFYARLQIQKDRLEVNPVDLAALEVLRMKEPQVFEHLAVGHLAESLDRLDWPGERAASDRTKLVDAAVASADQERRSNLTDLLKDLFPQIQGRAGDEARQSWDADLRVCDAVHYSQYFSLVLPRGTASSAEFDALRKAASTSTVELLSRMSELKTRNLLDDVFRRFPLLLKDISFEERHRQFEALCLIAEQLPQLPGYGDKIESRSLCRSAAKETFLQASPTERGAWLLKILERNETLDVPASFAEWIARGDSGGVQWEIDSNTRAQIVELAVKRIESAAKTGGIWQSPWMGHHLLFWSKQRGPKEVREWVASEVNSEDRAIRLASGFLGITLAGSSQRLNLDAGMLETIADVKTLGQFVEQRGHILPDDQRQSDIVMLIRKARNLVVENKPLGIVKLQDSDP